jgi:hypothetical protein
MWKYKGHEVFIQIRIQRTRQGVYHSWNSYVDDNNGGVDEIKQYRDASIGMQGGLRLYNTPTSPGLAIVTPGSLLVS